MAPFLLLSPTQPSTLSQLWGHPGLRFPSKQKEPTLGGPEGRSSCFHFTDEQTEALEWRPCHGHTCYWSGRAGLALGPSALAQCPPCYPCLVPQPLLAGPQSRQLGLGMGRQCLGEGAWAGEQVWWGGQQVQDNRATGEAGGAGATVGGEVAIVQAALVGPMQERHPCEPLGHPGSCSEVVQMPGRRHRAKPLPWVSATRQVAMTTSTFILVPLSGHGPAFVTKP